MASISKKKRIQTKRVKKVRPEPTKTQRIVVGDLKSYQRNVSYILRGVHEYRSLIDTTLGKYASMLDANQQEKDSELFKAIAAAGDAIYNNAQQFEVDFAPISTQARAFMKKGSADDYEMHYDALELVGRIQDLVNKYTALLSADLDTISDAVAKASADENGEMAKNAPEYLSQASAIIAEGNQVIKKHAEQIMSLDVSKLNAPSTTTVH